MFCDSCGSQLEAGQRFCPSCGKPAGMAVMPAGPSGRVARHLQLLSIFWFAASALNLIGAAALFILGNTLFGHLGRITGNPDFAQMHGFLQGLFTVLGVLVLLKSLAGFAAGWGLLQRESWARVLALVLGVISLINIPFGTALGVYTIWVLLGAGSDEEYQRMARAA